MSETSAKAPPRFLVCEDGDEYIRRFERFLGTEFRFARVGSAAAALAELARAPIVGLLMDLDFRRLPPEQLVGEDGPPPSPPTTEERTRWMATQGILILQHLRRQAIRLPALLFADLDDPEQVAFLEASLAPLTVVDSREGLAQLAARLRPMARVARG